MKAAIITVLGLITLSVTSVSFAKDHCVNQVVSHDNQETACACDTAHSVLHEKTIVQGRPHQQ